MILFAVHMATWSFWILSRFTCVHCSSSCSKMLSMSISTGSIVITRLYKSTGGIEFAATPLEIRCNQQWRPTASKSVLDYLAVLLQSCIRRHFSCLRFRFRVKKHYHCWRFMEQRKNLWYRKGTWLRASPVLWSSWSSVALWLVLPPRQYSFWSSQLQASPIRSCAALSASKQISEYAFLSLCNNHSLHKTVRKRGLFVLILKWYVPISWNSHHLKLCTSLKSADCGEHPRESYIRKGLSVSSFHLWVMDELAAVSRRLGQHCLLLLDSEWPRKRVRQHHWLGSMSTEFAGPCVSPYMLLNNCLYSL